MSAQNSKHCRWLNQLGKKLRITDWVVGVSKVSIYRVFLGFFSGKRGKKMAVQNVHKRELLKLGYLWQRVKD